MSCEKSGHSVQILIANVSKFVLTASNSCAAVRLEPPVDPVTADQWLPFKQLDNMDMFRHDSGKHLSCKPS